MALPAEIARAVRERPATTFTFKDDGFIPNHPRWPLILYPGAVQVADARDPAAVFERLFAHHGWGDSWRNGIFPYPHYHSRIHEALGIARGTAEVRFGGERGKIVAVKAGDVAVLPAGTGHQCLKASDDLLVVGAYPPTGTYDLCTTAADHARAVKTLPQVPLPETDPVYGADGGLRSIWK